jgi:dTDP-4-amino-4,6-dideoxygalactose transaminase
MLNHTMNKTDEPPNLVEIPFIKPFVPDETELLPYLKTMAATRQLTNGGPIHAAFEHALMEYLKVEHISLFANGTLALMIALKSLDLKGEVITTPFTSPATLQAIYWNNLTPVFADINEADLNIDVSEIQKAITSQTKAILPVHLFGFPCDVSGIEKVGKEHNLKVIYDAAHCFGVKLHQSSVCSFGDLSAMSFHATKIFNTLEGGAVICRDGAVKRYIDALKNTGIAGDHSVVGYGVNAKMNEMQAAFGLCQLKHIEKLIAAQKAATLQYKRLLKDVRGVRWPKTSTNAEYNYGYFPMIINPEEFGADRDALFDFLTKKKITTRKYFYPLISDSPQFARFKNNPLPVAQKISKSILCLPLFHDISHLQIEYVVNAIKQFRQTFTK